MSFASLPSTFSPHKSFRSKLNVRVNNEEEEKERKRAKSASALRWITIRRRRIRRKEGLKCAHAVFGQTIFGGKKAKQRRGGHQRKWFKKGVEGLQPPPANSVIVECAVCHSNCLPRTTIFLPPSSACIILAYCNSVVIFHYLFQHCTLGTVHCRLSECDASRSNYICQAVIHGPRI